MVNFVIRLLCRDITDIVNKELLRVLVRNEDKGWRLPNRIRVVRSRFIPWVARTVFRVDISGIAIDQTIVFPEGQQITLPMVMHEYTHTQQAMHLGKWRFFYRWFTYPTLLEMEAEKVEANYRRMYGDVVICSDTDI